METVSSVAGKFSGMHSQRRDGCGSGVGVHDIEMADAVGAKYLDLKSDQRMCAKVRNRGGGTFKMCCFGRKLIQVPFCQASVSSATDTFFEQE